MNRTLLAAALALGQFTVAAIATTAHADAPAPAATAAATAAKSEKAPAHAPVFLSVLPAAVGFVAWLPVDKQPEFVDLDLRVEVVMPHGCGDKLAGLLRHGGPGSDGDDAFDVIVERNAVGDCKTDAARIGDRTAIRVRLPEGAKRELNVGGRTIRAEHSGKRVTLDGEDPGGDVPGAPPTARPSTLVVGETSSARLLWARRVAGTPESTDVKMQVMATWPTCAGAPLGLLGHGDSASHFALTHFAPIAKAPLDAPCAGLSNRSAPIETVVRVPRGAGQLAITVGASELTVKPEAASTPPRAAKPAAAR